LFSLTYLLTYLLFVALVRFQAAKLANPGNYKLWGPGQDGFLYVVSGDATDATYGIMCVPSYGYEIGTQYYVACDEFENDVLPIVFESFFYAAKSATSAYNIPQGPDIMSIDVGDQTDGMISLTIRASDSEKTRFEFQPIAAVRVFVDEHPYDVGAMGVEMEAADGAFDTDTEVATMMWDVSGLEAGKKTLYFEAEDTDGFKGPVSAVYVTIGSSESENKDGSEISAASVVGVGAAVFSSFLVLVLL
jgi:carboxypeptidase T